MSRSLRFAATALGLFITVVASPAVAQLRGEGTMLVRQSTDCSGTGNTSTVHFPFSVLFTGFAPGDTGEVTAFTQPGGVQVGHRRVTVDEQGNRCELVDGTVPPGQYKLVYDFGSGTGKQKLIQLVAPPTASSAPSPSADPSPEPSPSAVSPSATPSTSVAPSAGATPSASVAPSASPSAGSSPPGVITFTPLPDGVRDQVLPRTGADVSDMLALGLALLISGACLLMVSRRRAHRI